MPAQVIRVTPSAATASVKLRVSVATTVPVASVTSAYPIVSAAYTSPIANVTSAYPVANVAYILLVVGAYLDTTGRFKYTDDIFSAGDSTSLSTAKIADADTFALADDTTLSSSKTLSDTATLGDSVLTVLIFIREFADTASLADANTLLVSPAYSDTVTASETSALSIDKALTDSFALNDLSDAAGPTFSFADFTNNTVLASDSSVVDNAKGLLDLISLADSGTVTSQGYCDLTYFAEDYVGESRTF